MSGKKLDYKISEEYEEELLNIQSKLEQISSGRVYEISNVRNDAYLATNVSQLKEMLNDLLSKIQNGKPGIDEQLVQKFLNKWTIFLFCSILFSSNQKEH